MKKLIKHIKIWNIWRKRNANGHLHHILVLFNVIKSPTMLHTFLPEEGEE